MNPFEVEFIYEIEEGVWVELKVTGVQQPATLANFRGHPDRWNPAEGGELEDIKVFNSTGCPLPGDVVRGLINTRRFTDEVLDALV